VVMSPSDKLCIWFRIIALFYLSLLVVLVLFRLVEESYKFTFCFIVVSWLLTRLSRFW
jgi:hypothetical protein